jgi:hypothetical protein
MKYAVEMGSGAVIYQLSFGSTIQKFIRSHTHIDRQHADRISLLSSLFFFKIRKVG